VALLVSPIIVVVLFWPRALALLPSSKESLHGRYWRFLRFGLVSYIGDLAFVLSNRVAIILSRPLLDDMAEIGFLGYAFMVYLMARQLAFVIGETCIPTLVRYHTSGDTAQFSRTMDHVWRYTNILVFAAALVIYEFAGPIITGIVDPAFQRSAVLIKLLDPVPADSPLCSGAILQDFSCSWRSFVFLRPSPRRSMVLQERTIRSRACCRIVHYFHICGIHIDGIQGRNGGPVHEAFSIHTQTGVVCRGLLHGLPETPCSCRNGLAIDADPGRCGRVRGSSFRASRSGDKGLG